MKQMCIIGLVLVCVLASVPLVTMAHDHRHEVIVQNTNFGTSTDRPGFYQNALQKAVDVKANLEQRHASITDKFLERASTTRSNLFDRIGDVKANLADRRAHFASTSALRRANLTDAIKERIIDRANHAARLLDAMLERLKGLADRIEARINELADAGEDVSAARAALGEADDALAETERAIEAVKDAMHTALDSDTPREKLQAVKTLAQTAKEALRAAHQALMEAVRELPKRGIGAPSPTTTSP
ncbi:hypothetical protein L0Y34_00340 [Candidatus Parcubacteria bacterium]|nr:hypothetical protein [Candidatus Parcubacteria bacterium]